MLYRQWVSVPGFVCAFHATSLCLLMMTIRFENSRINLFNWSFNDKINSVFNLSSFFSSCLQVIKVIKRMDRCTSQQATLFAILVNRDGRTPLLTDINMKTACERCALIAVGQTFRFKQPLVLKIY